MRSLIGVRLGLAELTLLFGVGIAAACGGDSDSVFNGSDSDGSAGAGGASGNAGTGGGARDGGGAVTGDSSTGPDARSSCTNSLDCVDDPEGRGVCDASRGQCVECLQLTDCQPNHDCTAYVCVAFVPCKNSLDCPSGMVCNPGLGRCVECASDADCGTERACSNGKCRARCASDNDCTPFGLLCDKAVGHCVRCLRHVDCPADQYCSADECVADVCSPGDSACQGNGTAPCLSDGQGYGAVAPCPTGQTCRASAGRASCVGADGGSGGSGGDGGSSGTGGTGGAVDLMIDDMEDGDQRILPYGSRTGYWHSTNDGTGVQTPAANTTFLPTLISPARGTSALAMHSSGSGFTGWGSAIQVDFNNAASGIGGGIGSPRAYDVSGMSGISFYARGSGTLRVEVRTLATVTLAEGGACATLCNDHHGANLTVGSSWTPVNVSFSGLAQRGFGTPVAFARQSVIGLQFLGLGTSFDLWIDDLRFY